MPSNPTSTGDISKDFDLTPTDRLTVGAPAPLFKLADPSGEIWQLGQVHLSGRPVVLLFLRGSADTGSESAWAARAAPPASARPASNSRETVPLTPCCLFPGDAHG